MLEEIFEGLEVVILYVRVTSAGRLAREPHAIGLTHRGPRLIGLDSVLWHLVYVLVRIVLARQRQVHADPWTNVFGDEVDDFLWVGLVPHIDVDEPHGVPGVDGPTFLRMGGQR